MKIAYSPDADVLTIQLREERPADSRDLSEGVIVHLSAKGQKRTSSPAALAGED